MKMGIPRYRADWITALTMAALAVVGCNRGVLSPNAAAEILQKSFAKAEPEVKQEVARAGAALQAGDYTRALIAMDRAAQARPVDAEQKKAVGILIQQTRQAVQQNPKLNTPELYQATADLILRVHGEN